MKYDNEKLKDKNGWVKIQHWRDKPEDYGLKAGDSFILAAGKKMVLIGLTK